ncbi:MAG: hypothetical protein D6725_05325 [Planctomycetota bacterium]|nr:MAG: hypothetical protein D6725_05325 [Planctomycetota bacterium]
MTIARGGVPAIARIGSGQRAESAVPGQRSELRERVTRVATAGMRRTMMTVEENAGPVSRHTDTAHVELQRRLCELVCRRRWKNVVRIVAAGWLLASVLAAAVAFRTPRETPPPPEGRAGSGLLSQPAFRQCVTALGIAAAFSIGAFAYVRAANRRTRRRGLLPAGAVLSGGVWSSGPGRWCIGDAALRAGVVMTLEMEFPELDGRLLTACEQHPDPRTGRFHVLQNLLFEELCRHAADHDWGRIERPNGPTFGWLGLAALAVTLATATAWQRAHTDSAAPARWKLSATAGPTTATPRLTATVEPGDAEVEFGTSVVITAVFEHGPETRVWLVSGESASRRRHAMQRQLDGRTFTATLTVDRAARPYRVKTEGWTSRRFVLTGYRRPELRRIDARVVFPAYARRPPQQSTDVTRISVPRGGRLELVAWSNVPAAVVALVPEHAGEPETASTLNGLPGVILFEPQPAGEAATRAHPSPRQPDASTPDGPHDAERPPAGTAFAYRAAWVPRRSEPYRVVLFDARGHRNRRPPRFDVAVIPNRRPRLRLVFPGRDLHVSPLQELAIEAEAQDDFGLVDFGLVYQVPGRPPVRISLLESGPDGAVGSSARPEHRAPNALDEQDRPAALGSRHGTTGFTERTAPERTAPGAATGQRSDALPTFATANHLIALEELQLRPDQLLCYHAYAVDLDQAGRPRETFGDMFFAEVRPFDEVFRQGQTPPSGSQQGPAGNAQQAEQLAQQQKEVVNATWALLRHLPTLIDAAAANADSTAGMSPEHHARSDTPRPVSREWPRDIRSPWQAFAKDLQVVRQAQQAVRSKLDEVRRKLNDPQSLAYADQAAGHIDAALDALTKSATAAAEVEDNIADPLTAALQSEQLAYQALLKLRAREHQVVQGQNGGGQGQSSGRSAEQLKQLELTNRRNRYESERRAAQPPTRQRQRLQTLSRLRELARRQQDIRDRLRELQAQLLARSLEQSDEQSRRELRRLREAQRSLLHDLDALQQRLQQTNDAEAQATREQLQRTRAHIRRSAEELQRGRVGQAIAEASRAHQQLSRTRDSLRKAAASRFTEDIRRLRERSEELTTEQGKIAQRLQPAERSRPSLRSQPDRDELAAGLRRQRERLQALLDELAALTRRAETAEPLLARQLYETVRRAHSDRIDEALRQAADALATHNRDGARERERQAREGLQRLRDALRNAERAVLGDELNALKLARSQLDELAEAVRREWQSGSPLRKDHRTPAAAPDPQTPSLGDTAQRRPDRTQRHDAPASDRRGTGSPTKATTQTGPAAPGTPAASPEPNAPPRTATRTQSNADRPAAVQNDSKVSESAASPHAPNTSAAQSNPPPHDTSAAQSTPGASTQRTKPRNANTTAEPNAPSSTLPQRSIERSAASASAATGSDARTSGSPGQANAPSSRTSPVRRTPGRLDATADRAVSESGGTGGPGGPILGPGFRDWSDRMRELEEMVTDPALRDRLIAARESARQFRIDWKRHGKEPNWELVRATVWKPLTQVAEALDEEIGRRDADRRRAVPLEREPVPSPFSEIVRRYFEELGRGR